MLDIKFVRSNPEDVVAGMKKRGMDLDLAPFLALDEKRRALLTEVEQLKNTRNTVSKEIGKMKKAGENADEPALVLISVGEDNSYGHPAQKTLDRIASWGIPVRRTDLEGTIIIRG